MNFLLKYTFTLLLCLVAGFATHGQGTLVWEKPLARIFSSQQLRTAVQSRDNEFWVGISEIDDRPFFTAGSRTSAIAFDNETGDTLWYRPFFNQYTIESSGIGVAPAPNGHFWVVVKFVWDNSTALQGAGIAVFELDSTGQILQQKEFMVGCHSFYAYSVYAQADGGFIVTGTIARKANCTDWELFALRIDGNCNEVWQSIYTMPYDQGVLSSGLYPGNKLCIGYIDANTSYQNRMAFIDVSTGVLLYKKNTPSGIGHFLLYCYPMRDGSFMVGGVASDNTTINNAYLARTDANFNILWERIDNTAVGYGFSMKETADSCVIVRGNTLPANGRFMAKVNLKTGQELWRRYFSSTNNSTPSIISIEIGHDEDLYAFGSVSISNVTVGPDFYVARYTGVADFLQPSDYCSDSLRANFAGTWLQDTLRLHSTSNSGMVHQDSLDYQWLINGATVSLDSAFQQIKSSADYPQGLPVSLVITNFWGCKDTLTARVTPQGIVGNKPNIGGGAYLHNPRPNPSTQNVTIGYNLPANTKEAVLRVYELGTGRTVAERNLSALEADIQFNVSHWATGVYAYQLFINGAPVAVKQLVVTR